MLRASLHHASHIHLHLHAESLGATGPSLLLLASESPTHSALPPSPTTHRPSPLFLPFSACLTEKWQTFPSYIWDSALVLVSDLSCHHMDITVSYPSFNSRPEFQLPVCHLYLGLSETARPKSSSSFFPEVCGHFSFSTSTLPNVQPKRNKQNRQKPTKKKKKHLSCPSLDLSGILLLIFLL